jgi:uncharacterized membrane protein
MYMDIHPILVHFPVALLTIYALMEILPLENKFGRTYFNIKFAFLFIGVIASFPAYWTGGFAGEAIEHGPLGKIVEYHAFFAGATMTAGIVMLVAYLAKLKSMYPISKYSIWYDKYTPNLLKSLFGMITIRGFMVFAAILLLIFVTITGGLGGSLVYGPDADPFVQFLYKVFNLY